MASGFALTNATPSSTLNLGERATRNFILHTATRLRGAEFITFGLKQALACSFAASFFACLFLSRLLPPGTRYDALFLAAVALQIAFVATRLETLDELKVICSFHLVGLALELFKTHPSIRSWSYPEPALFKIAGVPLYSGFMYAAVGSYMCQAWRILKLRLTDYPSPWLSVPLSAAIYLNFFTHHFIPDFRWILAALVLLAFRRTRVHFTVTERERVMPLVLSFLLIGFFIWVAENIATLGGAWVYPDQRTAWRPVSLAKISSWALLVIISFIIVADLKHLKEKMSATPEPRRAIDEGDAA